MTSGKWSDATVSGSGGHVIRHEGMLTLSMWILWQKNLPGSVELAENGSYWSGMIVE